VLAAPLPKRENTDANTSDEQLLLVGADDVQVLPINDGDSQDGPALIAAGTAGTEMPEIQEDEATATLADAILAGEDVTPEQIIPESTVAVAEEEPAAAAAAAAAVLCMSWPDRKPCGISPS